MWLASSVTTTGINWESVATIVTAIVVVLGAVTGYVGRQITKSVTALGDKLELKLETKERVNEIDRRVTILEAREAVKNDHS
jgi:hypothetical protein